MDEPQTKKAKMDLDPIFKTFCEDKEKFEQLRSAVQQIKSGGQQKMIFRRINEANAREIVPFGIVPWSDATCILRFVDEDPGFVSAGVFFIPAIDILDKYCCADAIPEDPDHRAVLSILLQYLSSCKYTTPL